VECFVLGTGGMMPMPRRRLTSVAVRLEGRVYLFDAGEGTQVPYKELHLGLRALRVVAVSHLHADHCLGLPGLLMLRAQMPDPEPLLILGPPGLRRFLRHVRDDLAMYINYEIEVREWAPPSREGDDLAHEDDLLCLRWRPLAHSTFCLGFRLEEHGRPGRFDPEAAERLGVPFGPLRGKLQRGEAVVLADGRRVEPREVLGPPRRGRRVAFVTDTAPCAALAPLLAEADVAFLEGMFLPEHREEAVSKKHMAVDQAAQAAAAARVDRLVLVHVSPRYEGAEVRALGVEAARHHGRAEVARDGQRLEVPLPP
jgi:ribonuclease Z